MKTELKLGDFLIHVLADVPDLSLEIVDLKEFPPEPLQPYTLKFPTWLQKNIVHFRDQWCNLHKGHIPNVLILQDSYLVNAQFSDEVLRMRAEDRPEWFKIRFRELYDKFREWQGELLFEWYGLKVFNRHHVIGNRGLPMIFLEVRDLHRSTKINVISPKEG